MWDSRPELRVLAAAKREGGFVNRQAVTNVCVRWEQAAHEHSLVCRSDLLKGPLLVCRGEPTGTRDCRSESVLALFKALC